MKKIILSVLIASMLTASLPMMADAKIEIQQSGTANKYLNKNKTSASSSAEPTPEPTPTPETTPTFTVDDAVKYALENNKNLLALHETVTSYEYAIKSSKQTYDSMNDKGVSCADINTYLVVVGYTLESDKYQLRKTNRSIVQTEYDITMGVKKAFYEYINKQKKLEIAKKNLESAEEKYSQAKVKHEQNMISDLELDQFAANVQSSENTVKTQEREIGVAMLSFKNTIGYPLDKNLNISGTFTLPEMDKTGPADAVAKSMSNVTMIELNDSFDLTKYYHDLNFSWYSGNQPQYHTAKANLKAAEQQHENSINQNTISIVSAYNTMVNVYDSLDVLNTQVELAKKNVEVQKLRYDMGMITSLDYIDAVNSLAELELTIADTSLNAYLASLNYRALYDCTDTSDTGEKVVNNAEKK